MAGMWVGMLEAGNWAFHGTIWKQENKPHCHRLSSEPVMLTATGILELLQRPLEGSDCGLN